MELREDRREGEIGDKQSYLETLDCRSGDTDETEGEIGDKGDENPGEGDVGNARVVVVSEH